MPYVDRDAQNNIISHSEAPVQGFEYIDESDPEFQAYLTEKAADKEALAVMGFDVKEEGYVKAFILELVKLYKDDMMIDPALKQTAQDVFDNVD